MSGGVAGAAAGGGLTGLLSSSMHYLFHRTSSSARGDSGSSSGSSSASFQAAPQRLMSQGSAWETCMGISYDDGWCVKELLPAASEGGLVRSRNKSGGYSTLLGLA